MADETENALTGRELDAAVAELMGWTDVQPDCYTPVGKEWCGTHPSGEGGFYGIGRRIIPHFSTDESAAAEVREWAEFQVTEEDAPIRWHLNSHGENRGWKADLRCLPTGADRWMPLVVHRGPALPLPEAICRAAVAAKGRLRRREG